VAPGVECLLSNCEALSSNTSTVKKRKVSTKAVFSLSLYTYSETLQSSSCVYGVDKTQQKSRKSVEWHRFQHFLHSLSWFAVAISKPFHTRRPQSGLYHAGNPSGQLTYCMRPFYLWAGGSSVGATASLTREACLEFHFPSAKLFFSVKPTFLPSKWYLFFSVTIWLA
jgi:hypothetical protein